MNNVCLVAIDMGYGHLRAADALARVLDVPIWHLDRPPLATPAEAAAWGALRKVYEVVSRAPRTSFLGRTLDAATAIAPLDDARVAEANNGVRLLDAVMALGVGRGLNERLRKSGEILLTTFYSPALAADRAGLARVACVVTDSDINRAWAPLDAPRTRILYLAPSALAADRLRAYGVPAERIRTTGFPLPDELCGGRDLPIAKLNLERRVARLSATAPTEPPLVTFAVGGAGAQTEIVRAALPSLARPLRDWRLRVALVAGIRAEVAARFASWLAEAGLAEHVEILLAADHESYFRRFNQLLARTDILWTKPSEMTFFAALGLPIVFAPPVGAHEQKNLDWAVAAGAGVAQGEPGSADVWLTRGLADGSFARMAQAGLANLPNGGTYAIAAELAAFR